MFAKLLKHEFRSTWKTLGIFSIAALCLSIPGSFFLRVINHFSSQPDASPAVLLATGSLSMLLVFVFLALVVYVAGTEITLLARFYKSRFTDEGYLTFTLPVRSSSIFLSSYVNMLLWTGIASVIAILSALIILLFGTATEGLINTEVFKFIEMIVDSFTDLSSLLDDPLYLPLIPVQILVSFLYAPLMCMVCLTLGAVWAKKHKILASFGVYYLISIITSTFSSFLTLFLMLTPADIALSTTYLFSILLSVILGAVGYFLSIYMLNHKLNLP